MQQYQGGEVLLVTFPFADRVGAKLRPTLVLRDVGDDDIILALISSRAAQTAFDVAVSDWRRAGLNSASIVRVDKVHTIAKAWVRNQIGRLTPQDWSQVHRTVQTLWATI